MTTSYHRVTLALALSVFVAGSLSAQGLAPQPPRLGDRTCADWSASPSSQEMRAWLFGYYSGVAAAKSGGPSPLLIRPMEFVSEPDYFGTMGKPTLRVSTRAWTEEGLAKRMNSRCAFRQPERLIDAAAAIMGDLIHVLPAPASAR